MNILIVEDEHFSAQHLRDMLAQIVPGAHISGPLDSVSSIKRWFSENPQPDLAFFDIQLADGLSFEAFEQAEIHCPVIFTTAFDEYAIKAFKLKSVDYLLKPINKTELENAVAKYRNIFEKTESPAPSRRVMEELIAGLQKKYKSRFSLRVGEHLISLRSSEISYFYSAYKSSFLCSMQGRHYDLDRSLDQLESMLDPQMFFRISRKFIINIDAIKDILVHSGSRLKVVTQQSSEEEMIVSREKVKEFREWLDG